jgi:hypothetical protein
MKSKEWKLRQTINSPRETVKIETEKIGKHKKKEIQSILKGNPRAKSIRILTI